jgi:hypothetical protein
MRSAITSDDHALTHTDAELDRSFTSVRGRSVEVVPATEGTTLNV